MGIVWLEDEHILDMQLNDGVIVMVLARVPTPPRTGDRLLFPSFGTWTVLQVRRDPHDAALLNVALRLKMDGENAADTPELARSENACVPD